MTAARLIVGLTVRVSRTDGIALEGAGPALFESRHHEGEG